MFQFIRVERSGGVSWSRDEGRRGEWRRRGGRGGSTGVEIELDVCVFLLLSAVVVRAAFHAIHQPVSSYSLRYRIYTAAWVRTYTCTFRISSFALGLCGLTRLESAISAPTEKATVVKKPKTFCSRTSEECIAAVAVPGLCRR